MGFVFFMGGTIVLSFILDTKNGMRLYKDMADLGYKIDSKRYNEIIKKIAPNATKINLLTLCIPIYNIFAVYQRTLEYNDIRDTAYDQLNVLGVLEEMTELEKKNYEKKPTGFRAIFSPFVLELKLLGAQKISLDEGDIYFKVVNKGKKGTDIKIVETTIDTDKISLEKQRKMIKETRELFKEHSNLLPFIDTAIKGTTIYGQEEYFRKLRENEPVDYNIPVDEETLSQERKVEIRNLKLVKAYLLSVKEENKGVAKVKEKGQFPTR